MTARRIGVRRVSHCENTLPTSSGQNPNPLLSSTRHIHYGERSLVSSPVPSPIVPDDFIARIHASGRRLVLAVTGGGSQAISTLLAVPGGSRSVLAAEIPYSPSALVEWLHARPEHFCNEHTARLMAMAAYQQAVRLATVEGGAGPIAGVACTASLASDRPKRGPHRIHVAAQTAEVTAVASLEVIKEARDRHVEERIAGQLLLNMVAQACGLAQRLPLALRPPECVIEDGTVAPPDWQSLVAGEANAVLVDDQRTVESAIALPLQAVMPAARPHVVFPGAFHPLHEGHLAMARFAAQRLQAPVAWEISITNVDKPPLDFHEMRRRSAQFAAGDQGAPAMPLWFTRAPTFVAKSSIFPGATFIVGADTIDRIAHPRYYRGDAQARDAAIESIVSAGCRFLVFGRKADDRFQTLDNLPLPERLRGICDAVTEEDFRADISSTALRQVPDGDD